MANEEPRLVATCPVCNKAYFADGKSKLIVTSYMVPQGQRGLICQVSGTSSERRHR